MVQDLIEEVASMKEVFSHMGASHKTPLDSGKPVDCHQRGWYPLSVNETAQLPMRIEGSVVFR